MSDDQQVQFLPFIALNDFMLSEYRQQVVHRVLQGYNALPGAERGRLDAATRRFVQVQGFRNPAKAPIAVRIRPTAKAFGEHSEMVSVVVAAWAALVPELAKNIHDLLISRGWQVYPVEMDRTKLPGFLPTWPEKEDFDVLLNAYRELHPDEQVADDDLSLMAVWLSQRLPYHHHEHDHEMHSHESDVQQD